MTTKKPLNIMWFIFALWIGFTAGFCGAKPTTAPTSQPLVVTDRLLVSQWLQAILDTANAAGLKLKAIQAIYEDGSTYTVNPVVVKPPATQPTTKPTSKPLVRKIVQAKNAWAHDIPIDNAKPVYIANEHVTDGGGIHYLSTAPLYVTNFSNDPNNQTPGGKYALAMLWPPNPPGKEGAVSKAVFDLTGCSLYQGVGEALLRTKCDDFTMIGGTYYAHLKPDGSQIKPIFELRHGKLYHFIGGKIVGGYPEIGEQQTKQADGTSKLETMQHPGNITFERFTFTVWTPSSHNLYARKPGITGHVIFINCINPDGKTFSKTE